MPELPEVETVRRGLQPALEGARIVAVEKRRDKLRFLFPERFVERLTGVSVTSLGRRAKYLLADLSSGEVLIAHLGMSGSFRIEGDATIGAFHFPRSKDVAHDHVVFHLESGLRVVYNDPRRFGLMDLSSRATIDAHPLLAGLGVEPTGNALDAAMLARLFAGKAAPLKAALLDQRLIAGLGNIYVCEALHRAGLSPRRAAGSIVRKDGGPTKRAEKLAIAIREVIAEAIAAGGSTLNDYMQVDGELGYFQHSFRVYDCEGEPCRTPGCRGTIERIVQSGRSTFWCPACQR